MTGPYPARRRDPQTVGRGGELVLVALCAAVLALALTALVGLGLAAAWFGSGWVWPHGSDTVVHTLGGLLAGHPGHGLPAPDAARLPDRTAVYGSVAGCEAILLSAATAGGVLVARYRRPGDTRAGMASRAEAARVLGGQRLRQGKRIIRPDLYHCHGRTAVQPDSNGARR